MKPLTLLKYNASVLCSLISLIITLPSSSSSSPPPSSPSPQNLLPFASCTSHLDCPAEQFCLETTGHCTCLGNYMLNPKAKTHSTSAPACIRKINPDSASSSSLCTASSQCIPFARCITGKGRCACLQYGDKWAKHPLQCAIHCTADADCQAHLANSECRGVEAGTVVAAEVRWCSCREGFTYHEGSCTRSAAPLGGRCETNRTAVGRTLACGLNAFCQEAVAGSDGAKNSETERKTCACLVEAKPDPGYSRYDCQPINCTSNGDCQRWHANTVCRVDWGNRCRCAANFEEKAGKGGGCWLRAGVARLGERCRSNGDCNGDYAECVKENKEGKGEGVCQCKGGCRPEVDGVNCRPMHHQLEELQEKRITAE